ncbi:MAG: hypothetical protein SFV54_20675 [Bryobacteraceae bacterium]|nr:hypothetical protein [Bryobacteraceae bacterium]
MRHSRIHFLLGIAAAAGCFAQSSIDQSFGSAGKVISNFGNQTYVAAAHTLPDGKILVAGSYFNGVTSDVQIVRYTADGAIDTAFGTGGVVRTDLGKHESSAAVRVLGDGKILVAGSINDPDTGDSDVLLLRYLSDGALDTTFASNTGWVQVDFDGRHDATFGMAVMPDGRIVVAANTRTEETLGDAEMARFSSSGMVEAKYFLALSPAQEQFTGFLAQPDGKFVLTGLRGAFSFSLDFLAARVDGNGVLDTSFGAGGIALVDFGTPADFAMAAALQPDGKIVLAGVAGSDMAVTRLTNSGLPDPAFGTNGLQRVPVSATLSDAASALALQQDGKILLGGQVQTSENSLAFTSARILPNGATDTSFGVGGAITTDFGTENSNVTAFAFQPDGRIIAAGTRASFANGFTSDAVMCRYGCGDLRPMVEAVTLESGRKNSLLSKVDAANKAIAADRPSATGILGAFINEVQAYRGAGILTPLAADGLIAAAQCVLSTLR